MVNRNGASTQDQTNRPAEIEQSARTELLSRSEAAAYLRVTPKTMANWASSGRYELKVVKIGKRLVRYRKSDLDLLIQNGLVTSMKKDIDHE
jgi:excisionase family DNA binding protein